MGNQIIEALRAAGLTLAPEATDTAVIEALKVADLPESALEVAQALKAAGLILPAPPMLRPVNGLASAVGMGLEEIAAVPWRNEYTLEGFACPQINLVAQKCEPGEGENNNEIADTQQTYVSQSVRPVQLEVVLGCSTFDGRLEESYWRNAVLRSLDLCQFNQLAKEFWTGEKSEAAGFGNRYLASVDAIDVVSGEVFSEIDVPGDLEAAWLVDAVGSIEDYLGKCTCSAVHLIHTSPVNVAHMSQCGLLRVVGNRLFTYNGTLVVADDGYPGTGPAGAPAVTPETNYIYGTSTVSYRIDPETMFPNGGMTEDWTKVATNDIFYQGQRWAMISWLCCHFMARVQLG